MTRRTTRASPNPFERAKRNHPVAPDDPDDPDPDVDRGWGEGDYNEDEEEEEWWDGSNAQLKATKMLCDAMKSIARKSDSTRDSKKVRKEADKIEFKNLQDAANLWKWEITTAKRISKASAYADEAEVEWFKGRTSYVHVSSRFR